MNNKPSSFIAAVAFFCFATLSGLVIASPPQGYKDADVERVSRHINEADYKRANPSAINGHGAQQAMPSSPPTQPRRISVKQSPGWFQATSPTVKVSIPDTENRAVWLSRGNNLQGGDSLIVNLPKSKNIVDAKVASDGSVVYPDYQQATDLAIQSFEDSARILTVLNGTDAPSRFTYQVNVPAGGKIEKSNQGGVIVFDKQGSLIGGFMAPWAIDSVGKKIPTRYEVLGHNVVQVIDHLGSGAHYPIVADPWLFKALISSASWAHSSYGWTLRVKPTTWARLFAGSYAVGVAGWNELYGKYKNKGLNTNLGGMRDQYICHQQVVAIRAPRKPTWNLDEWRPDISYLGTVNALCNPGAPGGGKIID
jgi:Protein of unknown function (DUF2599)